MTSPENQDPQHRHKTFSYESTMSGDGAITFELIRNWVPIVGSLLALAIAIGAYVSDTTTRLKILEITVERSIEQRLNNIEQKHSELQREFEDHLEEFH